MDLLPKVFRTEGTIADFDPSKIFESILKETRMIESEAKQITELVVRRIISSGIKFLSGPHIREIVCSILSEEHFENERKLYTRIGMPLMDYEEILEKKYLNNSNLQINPEKLHHQAANQIAEEYAHLRILNTEESKAHLSGDIHINGLNYFVLRPFNQFWDPRLLLRYGLPPIKGLTGYYKEKPAKDLRTAISHLVKWIGMVQSEFYGNQVLNHFTTFLSQYLVDISFDRTIQEMKRFLVELSNLPLLIGRNISRTFIFSSASIIEEFCNIKTINENGNYKDYFREYQEECKNLFISSLKAYEDAIQNNQLISLPRLYILIDKDFVELIQQFYPKLWKKEELLKSVSFSILHIIKDNLIKNLAIKPYYNYGTLQNISLNLPRYAFISKDESHFLELLRSELNMCSKILLKKYEIIEKRINSRQLPFCSSIIENEPLFKLENQSLSMSLVGLNESIKYLTNYELHENPEAIKLSNSILNDINEFLTELSEKNNKSFILSENTSEIAINRFQKLDSKDFPKDLTSVSIKKKYTNSVHYRDDIDIGVHNKIKNQGNFHKKIHAGAISSFSLNQIKESGMEIKDFILKVINESSLSSLKFSS
ncbi:MAG: anaerobic ribonucleoside-triphosphate reductase [Promethearchaeota archaeon]